MAFVPISSFTTTRVTQSISKSTWQCPSRLSPCPGRPNMRRSPMRPTIKASDDQDAYINFTMDNDDNEANGKPPTSLELQNEKDYAEYLQRESEIQLDIKDGMDFFRYREGDWDSWRVTHHLAFRRSESGESRITMRCLDASDERIVKLCNDWDVPPESAQGGCFVTWKATLAWDQEGENHEGETVFALIPDETDETKRRGKILRDRGYAEVVPIAGTYNLDSENSLNLETPYEGGAVVEKFSFDGRDVVNRLSTVKRFGGYSTATYAMEQRVGSAVVANSDDDDNEQQLDENELTELIQQISIFGRGANRDNININDQQESEQQQKGDATYSRISRWTTSTSTNVKPPVTSAFATGFGGGSQQKSSSNSAFATGFSTGQNAMPPPPSSSSDTTMGNGNASETNGKGVTGVSAEEVNQAINELASKAGVDLSKIPPSMRDDFLATFEAENNKGVGSNDDV